MITELQVQDPFDKPMCARMLTCVTLYEQMLTGDQ